MMGGRVRRMLCLRSVFISPVVARLVLGWTGCPPLADRQDWRTDWIITNQWNHNLRLTNIIADQPGKRSLKENQSWEEKTCNLEKIFSFERREDFLIGQKLCFVYIKLVYGLLNSLGIDKLHSLENTHGKENLISKIHILLYSN